MYQKELKLNGLTGPLAALEMGEPNGTPLVAVHGWLDNAATFIPLARELQSWRWISLDLPGHGRSAHRPPGSIYHFTDYVADVHRAASDLGLDRFNLIGHSLGAGVAAVFAAAFPDRVENLLLIDGIGPISGDQKKSLDQLRKSMAFLDQPSAQSDRFYSSREALIERRMAAGTIARHSVETLLQRGTESKGMGATVLSDSRLKQHSPIYMGQDKVLSILRGIEARTLLVMARDGLIHCQPTTNDRIAAIPDIEVCLVEGHHHVHLDEPQRVAAPIAEFLDRDMLTKSTTASD